VRIARNTCVWLNLFLFAGGTITDFYSENQTIAIYYNDYGTIAKVPRSHVRILEPKFAEFDAQAILCKLSGIVPTTYDGSWPQEAGNLILKMVQDCDGFLVAKVVDVTIHNDDKTSYELEILLYDTVTNTNPEGLIITENLIDAGMAARQVDSNGHHDGPEDNGDIDDIDTVMNVCK